MSGESEAVHSRRLYRARVIRQLISWVAGKPYHNETDDEHCPDMSCCHAFLFEPDYDSRLAIMRRLVYHMGEP